MVKVYGPLNLETIISIIIFYKIFKVLFISFFSHKYVVIESLHMGLIKIWKEKLLALHKKGYFVNCMVTFGFPNCEIHLKIKG